MTWEWVGYLAQTPSGLDNPLGLGVIAGAMVFGAGVCYRWTTLPERAAKEKAEARAEKEAAEKTEAYKLTLPALAQTEALADRILAVIPNPAPRRSGQRSQQ